MVNRIGYTLGSCWLIIDGMRGHEHITPAIILAAWIIGLEIKLGF
jgi:hypothetical protein